MSQTAALLILFIVLPLVLAPIVVAVVARRSPTVPPELRTSALLRDGEPAEAEIVSVKNKGNFLDRQPMVAFQLGLRSGGELSVTQAVPRALLAGLKPGMVVEVRLSPDRTAGAIVFSLD